MTDQAPDLAAAEEWLRAASINPTPAALLTEYDRRDAALAATEPVVEAARAVAEGYRRPELWDELWGRVEALAARVAELPTEERKVG